MNRLDMPAAMPADVAERLSDVGGLHDAADKAMLQQARDDLADKLKNGEQVGRCTLRDLIDCELNGDRYKLLLEEFEGILRPAPGATRDYLADQMANGLIERYLETHTDLVEERAYEIMADRDDDYQPEE